MTLLQPIWLLVAGLIAVPLLLHLLRREAVQRIAFPALRYLRSAERRTARSLRLRDLLLLAVRVALLALLAVAAARPLAGRGGPGDHAPTDAVLVLDNSASMGRVREGRTLLDHQREAARDVLSHASGADRFWVYPAAGPPAALGVDAARARAAIDSVVHTDAGVDLPVRLAELTEAVPVEEGRQRELMVFTDAQASAFGGVGPDLEAWGRVVVAVAEADGEGSNRYVADLRLEPDGPVVPGRGTSAVISLADGGASAGGEADTLDVRLVVDGTTVAMARGITGSDVVVPLPEMSPGPHTLRAEIQPSGLRSDDVRRLGLTVETAPSVRVMGSGEGFLGTAVSTLRAEGRLGEAGSLPIVIVEGPDASPPPEAATIVMVPPRELTSVPAFQQRLDALGIPWRVTAASAAGGITLVAPPDAAELEGLRVETAHRLERRAAPETAEDSVLVRTSDGAPWLVRGRVGDRVYLLLASALHPDAIELPVHAAMVPFVETMALRWSRPVDGLLRSIDAGTTVTLPPRLLALRTPADSGLAAEAGAPWTPLVAGAWTLVLPDAAGTGESPRERRVGVNVPVPESDTRTASRDGLDRAFGGAEVEVVDAPAAASAAFGSRRGGEATPWIVAALVLLALLEIWLAAPMARSRAEAAEDRR